MNIIENAKDRFAYIDSLRGLAILGVILDHTGSLVNLDGPARKLTDTGGYGVNLFFVISAFTIFHMLSKHSSSEQGYIRNFFIRRLFRIVPVYWFGILLYSSVYGLESRGWLPGPEPWHYLLHFSLMNLLHPETQSSVVPGGWSISCEVLFYLTVPVLFSIIRSVSGAYLALLASVFLLPLLALFIQKISNGVLFVSTDPTQLELYWSRFPLNTFGCFGFGIFLFYLQKIPCITASLRHSTISLATVFAIVALFLGVLLSKTVYPLDIHVFSFLFMSIGLVLAAQPWWFIVNPILTFIGRISYSAYLLHFLIIKKTHDFIMAISPSLPLSHLNYFLVFLCIVLILTIPLAYGGYYLIESPSIKASKRLIARLERSPAS